jgi:hypothetical protein
MALYLRQNSETSGAGADRAIRRIPMPQERPDPPYCALWDVARKEFSSFLRMMSRQQKISDLSPREVVWVDIVVDYLRDRYDLVPKGTGGPTTTGTLPEKKVHLA